MNWEALGAIAETIGAIGVIGSLLYLALQIRQGNRDASVQAHQGIGQEYTAHSAIVTSEAHSTAFLKGLNSYTSLEPEERLKFDYCIAGYINLAEHAMLLSGTGKAATVPDMYEQYVSKRLFSYPGVKDWWDHGDKAGFSSETQAWVDEQLRINQGGKRFWEYDKDSNSTDT